MNKTHAYCHYEDPYVEFIMFTFDIVNATLLPLLMIHN